MFMKHVQRLLAWLLMLVLLVGTLPARSVSAADAATYDGNPSADYFQVVIDYGKTVNISLTEVKAGIHTNRNGSVGSLVGFVSSGSCGELLSAAPTMTCNAAGKSLDTSYGVAKWVDSSTVSYTPNGILSDVDYFYAVYALSGSTAGTHIKVEIQIIPSSMMYYEAEELAGNGLDTYDTTTGQNNAESWGTKPEGASANDTQTYDNADYVSSMVIDRKQIPASSFFVDFDGTGNTYRYSKDPGYGGCNFDNAACWVHGTTSASDGVTANPGYYTLNLTSGKTQHYFQTTTSGGTEESEPLFYRGSNEHVFQMRFRMTGCADASTPKITLYLKRNTSDTNVNTSSIRTISLTAEQIKQLNNEEYVTVTDNLSNWGLYRDGPRILSFRFEVNGVTAQSGGKLIVDYIYMGGPTGLMLPTVPTTTEAQTKFLFFGFSGYKESQNTYSYTGTDFSSKNNWHSDPDSTGANNSAGLTFTKATATDPGTVSFTDGSSTVKYNFLQPGTYYNTAPFSYTATGNDYLYVRFKTSGGQNAGTPFITVDYTTGTTGNYSGAPGTQSFTRSSNYQEVACNTKIAKGTVIKNIRLIFNNTQGCTFTVDYFYFGPSSLKSKAVQTADKYLFFDFTNTINDQFRYMNPSYGNQNRDVVGALQANTNTTLSAYTTTPKGIYLTDATPSGKKSDGTADTDNSSRLYFWMRNLNFTPATNHYVQMRLMIKPIEGYSVSYTKVDDSSVTKPWIDFYFVNSAKSTYLDKQYRRYIDLTTELNRWITVTIPMKHANYDDAPITSIVPAVRGTQGAQVILDYVYLGPPIWNSTSDKFDPTVTGNPANKSLYFGFDNSNSARYGVSASSYAFNDTYANANYDTGTWTVGGTGSAISYNSTKGIASITVGTTNYNGPTLTSGTLKYHPYNADVLQTRFRLNGCKTNPNGNPRLEAKVTGMLNGTSTTHTISKLIADTNNFQSVTIPMKSELQKFTTVTKIVLQFYDIQGGTLEIDHIYLGDGTATSTIPTYGYDSAYSNDVYLSDGDSLFVEGKGVRLDPTQEQLDNGTYTYPEKYTEATFSFTGTGVDIISRTGPDQGTIRVSIYKSLPMTQENLERFLTVNNKGDMNLYQIPVASFHGLEHGTYYVKIAVNKGVTSDYPFLARGDDFYLDAIRVYNTIDVTGSTLTKNQQVAKDAYRADKEAYSYVKEIRDSLLSVANFNAALLENGQTSGAVFVDSTIRYDVTTEPTEENSNTAPSVNVDEVETGHRVVTLTDYKNIGPKNEVYLSPGQAIAFKLEKDTAAKIVSIDVGAKTVLGDGAVLSAGFVSTVDSTTLATFTRTNWNVNSASAQYFALDESKLTVGTDVYLVIYNSHTGTDKTKNILSVTDLKVCYEQKPTRTDLPQDGKKSATVDEPYRFVVDSRTVEAAEVFLNGKVETPVEPTPDPTPDIRIYHSLNLASDISVNYMVPIEDLETYDSFRMEIRIPVYTGDQLVGYRIATPESMEKDGYRYFTLSDLTAVYMNDVMEATLCMVKDGQESYSHTDFYSIADYAYAQLGKTNVTDSLKTLCADLLVYGAKAQIFKGYRTDALADSAMTEEQRAYCSDLDGVAFGSTNVIGSELETPVITWVGKALELNARVTVIYRVDLTGYEGNPTDLTMKVSYLNHKGEETTAILTDPIPYGAKANCYSFYFDSLLAAELRTVLTAQVYEGDTALSNTLTYSPDTYGNNKTGALGDLCRALFAYSDSAKAFFAN